MSIKDALTLKNSVKEIEGTVFHFRRPSAADMIAAVEESQHKNFTLWLVFNHLIEVNGTPVFKSVEEVMECDGKMILALASHIDSLYGEGGN